MIRTACRFTCSTVAVLILVCSSPGQTIPTFTRSDLTVGNSPVSLAVADFNGDGKLDIAVLANTTSTAVLSIFLGDGTGNFTFNSSFSTGFASTWLTAGDLSGDGLADLVVANSFSRSVSVFLATGNGTFGPRSDISLPGRIESVLLADFNGDHKLDLAAPNFESAPQYSVSVLLGNGDGTFGANTEYPTLNTPFVAIADDFNLDGKLDLAINGQFGGLSVLLGNGNGTFQFNKDASTGFAQSSHVVSGDLNGDGKADLAVANNADDSVSILLGNGDGSFSLQPPISIPVTPSRLAVADFNGDGFADLVVARRNSAKMSILLGKGDGTFPTSAEFDVGAGPQFVIGKDLNGDGKLDLVTANYDAGTVSVLLSTIPPPVSKPLVILVHGWCGAPKSFGNLGSLLTSDAGLVVGDPFDYSPLTQVPVSGSLGITIEELASLFAEHVRKQLVLHPGATQVDIVAHSMGGLITRAWMTGATSIPVPYSGEIRKIIFIGTPQYGSAAASLDLFRYLFSIAVPSNPIACSRTQSNQMQFGSQFLLGLHDRWSSFEATSSHAVPNANLLFIAGTGDSTPPLGGFECFNPLGCDDGVVNISSAVLPGATNIRYVPYKHASEIPIPTQTINGVTAVGHKSYLLVKSFLTSGIVPAQCCGAGTVDYNPPHLRGVAGSNRGLLVLRLNNQNGQPVSSLFASPTHLYTSATATAGLFRVLEFKHWRGYA